MILHRKKKRFSNSKDFVQHDDRFAQEKTRCNHGRNNVDYAS